MQLDYTVPTKRPFDEAVEAVQQATVAILHAQRRLGRARLEESGREMTQPQSSDPLHGITLETMFRKLVNKYGWEGLAKRIDINCFKNDPSIKASLKFLHQTP